jgi:origin recognition complex subunit 6
VYRLKKRLNLPSITSRPPCPPRVYKKLYNYLASALPDASASTPREPHTPRKNSSAPASARTTPKTPTTARRTPQTALRAQNAAEPPAWIMPAIRVLARTFAHPAVSPHVYTGVESLLPLLAQLSSGAETPSARSRRSTAPLPAVSEIKLCSLVVAVFLYVLVRVLDAEVTAEQYDLQRDLAVRTLLSAADVKSVESAHLVTETEEMMATAQQEGWLEMEWFLNVVLGEEGGEEMEGVEKTLPAQGSGSTSRKRRMGGGSAYVGLGTMLQEATDYLGEQRREEYKTWKAGIMARCEELEAGG